MSYYGLANCLERLVPSVASVSVIGNGSDAIVDSHPSPQRPLPQKAVAAGGRTAAFGGGPPSQARSGPRTRFRTSRGRRGRPGATRVPGAFANSPSAAVLTVKCSSPSNSGRLFFTRTL